MTSAYLRDNCGGEGRAAARPVASAVEVPGNRGVVSTRCDQVANPCHHAPFSIRIGGSLPFAPKGYSWRLAGRNNFSLGGTSLLRRGFRTLGSGCSYR